MGQRRRVVGFGLAVVATFATGAGAQNLGDRVSEVGDGWAVFSFDVDDDVEVCDSGLRRVGRDGETRMRWSWSPDEEGECRPGPVQLEIELDDGRIVGLRLRRPRSLSGSVGLGHIDARAASGFLVSLAYREATPEAAEQGFALARLPRGADPAPGLIRAARDRDLEVGIRRSAIFWSGQIAAEEVVGHLAEVARETDAEQSVRDAAVFALSRHQGAGTVPVLMDLAMTAPQTATRRAALFWLAQHDDERVVDFLADIILERGGG